MNTDTLPLIRGADGTSVPLCEYEVIRRFDTELAEAERIGGKRGWWMEWDAAVTLQAFWQCLKEVDDD